MLSEQIQCFWEQQCWNAKKNKDKLRTFWNYKVQKQKIKIANITLYSLKLVLRYSISPVSWSRENY